MAAKATPILILSLFCMLASDWSKVCAFECKTYRAGRFGQNHSCLSKKVLLHR